MPKVGRDRITSIDDGNLLTVAGAARLLGVHANTVRAWTDQGRLPCLRINSRGDRRYPAAELRRFLSEAVDEASPQRCGGRPLQQRQARIAELEEQSRRSALLLTIGNEINGQVDLSRILNRLVDYAQQLFNAEHASNLRLQPDGRFVLDLRRNLSDEFCAAMEQLPYQRATEDGWDGRSVFVIEVPNELSTPEEAAIIEREGIVTISAAPSLPKTSWSADWRSCTTGATAGTKTTCACSSSWPSRAASPFATRGTTAGWPPGRRSSSRSSSSARG